MEEIPKEQLEWFEAKQTENRYLSFTQEPFPVNGYSRNWRKGLLFIISSFLLFGASFSPAWGNPGHPDRLPDKVLIPIDELMNGEEEMDPSSDSNKQDSSDGSTETENQVMSEQQEEVVQSSNGEEKREYAEEKIKKEPISSNNHSKKEDNLQQKKTTKSDESDHSPSKKRNDPSDVRTENGGTLPNTATPFGTLLVRGIALVLLGLGLRSLSNKKIEDRFSYIG